jgi:hypothetical protein
MKKTNTTFDLYLNGRFPPAAPDVAGLTGCLRDRFELGSEATGFKKIGSARQFVWTTILELPLGPNIPDAYPGAPSRTMIWVPDQNGTPYSVIYVERERAYRGADFLRVYLVKGRVMPIEVKQASGSPDLTDVTTLIIDQTRALSLSQPAANQAELAVLNQQSIDVDASGLKLKGDAASPGNSKYYGTDGSGTKGWYALPASGMSNPMTTLGDLIYEDATPAPARLAGNTTTTRKFLRQTGTGSVSAAPAWDTLQDGDMPADVPLVGTLGIFPQWVKVTKTYSDFSTAGATSTINIYNAPAGAIVHGVKIKQSTQFSGGTISKYQIDVGVSGQTACFENGFDAHQAVAATTYTFTGETGGGSPTALSHTAATQITATATSTGDTLNHASQGSVDIWLLLSVVT